MPPRRRMTAEQLERLIDEWEGCGELVISDVDCSRERFYGSSFQAVVFRNCDFSGCQFCCVDLRGTDLKESILDDAIVQGCMTFKIAYDESQPIKFGRNCKTLVRPTKAVTERTSVKTTALVQQIYTPVTTATLLVAVGLYVMACLLIDHLVPLLMLYLT